MSDFGTELTRWMEERGVGVRELHRRSGYSAGYISQLRQRRRVPSPEAARDFDDALGADGALAACLPRAGEMNREHGAGNAAGGALEVMAWITGTNTSDDAIDEIALAADYLAEAHTRMAARAVLAEVLGVHQAVRALLRGGRQRLRQTRELLRTDAALLAHASLLFGDVGEYQAAREYGNAALLCAQEFEADEGIAWSVMAKTARWQDRFAEAAVLARRGFEVSGRLPVRAELAYREANAVALFGDAPRARQALQRAERAAENLDDDGSSVWSFPRVRQSIFALSVCVTPETPTLPCARRPRRTPGGMMAAPGSRLHGLKSGQGLRWRTCSKTPWTAQPASLRPCWDWPLNFASKPSPAGWRRSAPRWLIRVSRAAPSEPGSGSKSASSALRRCDPR